MKNKQLAKIFGIIIKYEFILLIVLGICAVWSKDIDFIWSRLVITEVILLVASLIFFVYYDLTADN